MFKSAWALKEFSRRLKAEYENMDMTNHQIYYNSLCAACDQIADRLLKEIIDDEEIGTIDKCMPDTPVWFIKVSGSKPELIETYIEKLIFKTKGGVYIKLACNAMYETSIKSVGKTVFFNEADAVKMIEHMNNH